MTDFRKLQNCGRADLATAVDKAIQLMDQPKKCCYNCEHYIEETEHLDESYEKKWCDKYETHMEPDEVCEDGFSRG